MRRTLLVLFLLGSALGVKIDLTDSVLEDRIDSAEDGAAVNFQSLSDYIDFPRADFSCSSWIYIESMANSDGKLMSLSTGLTTSMDVTWVDTRLRFSHNGGNHDINTVEARLSSKWFHIRMGRLSGMNFGVIQFRDVATTSQLTEWPEQVFIQPTSWFKAPVGAGAFKVNAT